MYENTNKPMMSRTRTTQDNLVKYLHKKTGHYYDLFNVAPFAANWSWERTWFSKGLFHKDHKADWRLLGTDPWGISNVPFWHHNESNIMKGREHVIFKKTKRIKTSFIQFLLIYGICISFRTEDKCDWNWILNF